MKNEVRSKEMSSIMAIRTTEIQLVLYFFTVTHAKNGKWRMEVQTLSDENGKWRMKV